MTILRKTLLSNGARDERSITAAILVTEHSRVAVIGAITVLANREILEEDGLVIRIFAAARDWLEKELAEIDRFMVELTTMGGPAVCELLALHRKAVLVGDEQDERSAQLLGLASSYLKLAISQARVDRLEASIAAETVPARELNNAG